MLLGLIATTALFGCSSNDENKFDLGNTTIGPYSFHVEQEGNWAPGTSTNYAIKANDGTPKPDQVSCYFGSGAASQTPVIATFDPNDTDFDCTYPTPAVVPADARLNIQVSIGGSTLGGWTNVAE